MFDPEIGTGTDYWQAPNWGANPTVDENAGTCSFGLSQIDVSLSRWVAAGYTEFRIKSVWFEFIPKFSKVELRSFIGDEQFIAGTGDIDNVIPPGVGNWWFYKPHAINIDMSPTAIGDSSLSEYFAQAGAFKRMPHQRFKISCPMIRWLHTYYGAASADNTTGQNQQYPDYAVSMKNRWLSLQPQGATYFWRCKAFQWCCESFFSGATNYSGSLIDLQPWRVVGHARVDVRRPISYTVPTSGALALRAADRAAKAAASESARLAAKQLRLMRGVRRVVDIEQLLKEERERRGMSGPMSQDTSTTMDIDTEEEGVATK